MSNNDIDDAERLFELDGLRGWASLSVLLFHIFCEIFGTLAPGFRGIIPVAFMNGHLAVAVFFVLSGEALSIPYWKSRSRGYVVRQIAKRYPRLTIPIFFSCFIVFLLWKGGLVFSGQAAPAANWLSDLRFIPSLSGLFDYSFFEVYGPATTHSYNPVLWTMRIEIFGSFIVFGILLLDSIFEIGAIEFVVFILAISLAVEPGFVCILYGLIFGRLHTLGFFIWCRKATWIQPVSWVMLGAALLFGASTQREFWVQGAGVLSFMQAASKYVVAGITIVFFVHCNFAVTRFLRSAISRFLGKISFPLYLVQFSVLISVTSGAIVFANTHGGLNWFSISIISALTIITSLAASVIFLQIERITHSICNSIGRMVSAGSQSASNFANRSGEQPVATSEHA
jgi:peptidoglycan/LPS O-acetylase OafA/YrhL